MSIDPLHIRFARSLDDSSHPLTSVSAFPREACPTEPQEVEALFNRIAPVYDQFNHWLSLGQHRVWKQMTVRWSQPFPGAVCLDVCCGSGDLARLLANAVGPTGSVTGIDFATSQLERAKQITYAQMGDQRIRWVKGDALHLPFDENQFDCITMGYGLRNVVNIPIALTELFRVLRPGGHVAILDFHRPDNPSIHQFQSWCLNQVVVPLATQFGLRDEYAYILPSLERFPQGHEQIPLARQAGFENVVHYPIVGGMMGILVARKGLP